MRCGVDTGGTFTDLVGDDGRIAKVLSTPDDPGRAIRQGLAALDSDVRPDLLAHGTTVATNALLERRGATVALVTTAGFADVIEIARQDRPSLYDPWADPAGATRPPPPPLGGRRPAGRRRPRDRAGGRRARGAARRGGGRGVPSPRRPGPSSRAGGGRRPGLHRPRARRVVLLRRVTRVPGVRAHRDHGPQRLPPAPVPQLPRRARGPGRGGAGHDVGRGPRADRRRGRPPGGPSAVRASRGGGGRRRRGAGGRLRRGGDLRHGRHQHRRLPGAGRGTRTCGRAAGFPIRLPSLDIHTIGAGGGSLARIDAGGALVVGPESAGAEPGPACYGLGGRGPTVTDADLVLGRIPAEAVFPGLGRLDRAAAAAALVEGGLTAEGVVRVVDAAMERALRAVSVERGVDPSALALVAFGGAGPLHACALAEALGMAAVVVPARAGVLSAVGLLCAPRQRSLVRSWPTPGDHRGIAAALGDMGDRVGSLVGAGARISTSVDCRYAGQSHELTVATADDFPAEHLRRNGYLREGAPVEVVALRASAGAPAVLRPADLGPVERAPARGPCVVAEADCTIWIPDGWSAEVGHDGSFVLTR